MPEPRHVLGDGAGAVAAVERKTEDEVPAVAAGAGGARQAEDEDVLDLPGAGPGLQRGDPDRSEAGLMEDSREALHLPPEERLHRLRGQVARGEARASGGEDDVHRGVGGPDPDPGANGVDLV